MEQYAKDVKAVLDGLNVRKALFVGLSMGGYLEFAFYRMFPELMIGIVLADTRAEADRPEQIQWRFELAQRTAAMGPEAVIAEMLPKLLAPARYDRDPQLVAQLRSMISQAPVPGIVGALTALADRADSSDLLHRIGIPALVLVGANDVLTTTADAERMAKGIAGAELVVVSDAGHLSNLEQPDQFTAALEGFAQKLFRN
jgi:pimeloyl-ACP methyl ester carboxylesterase